MCKSRVHVLLVPVVYQCRLLNIAWFAIIRRLYTTNIIYTIIHPCTLNIFKFQLPFFKHYVLRSASTPSPAIVKE